MKPTIVYCSDGNDLELLKASLYSAKKFVPDAEVYVLSDSVSQLDIPDAKLLDPTGILAELGFFPDRWGRKWPYASLYSLAIPLMPEFTDLDRVLYLDTDTLVTSEKAAELLTMDIGDCEVMGPPEAADMSARIDNCVRNDLCQEAMLEVLRRLWATRSLTEQPYVCTHAAIWSPTRVAKNGLDWYRQRLRWFWEAETRGKFRRLGQDFVNSMTLTGSCSAEPFDAVRHYHEAKYDMLKDAFDFGYVGDGISRVVVYSSDGGDKDRLLTSAASVRKFIGPCVRFYILTELEEYPGFKDAVVVNPMQTLTDLGFFKDRWSRKWPFSTLFRVAIPLLKEFSNVNRILYLDTDTLVRSKDADRLFHIKSNGFEVYGVQDVEARQWNIEHVMSSELSGEARQTMKEMWLDRAKNTQGYVNAGVIVEFLDEIRKNGLDNYAQKLKWFWESVTKGHFRFLDQDFINVMMDVSPSLSVRFNKFGGDASTDCIIQHFVSNTKKHMGPTAAKIGVTTTK